MNEPGVAVGATQTSSALVEVRHKTGWKKTEGRQEWITAIEVKDAASFFGTAAPHLRDQASVYSVVSRPCTA